MRFTSLACKFISPCKRCASTCPLNLNSDYPNYRADGRTSSPLVPPSLLHLTPCPSISHPLHSISHLPHSISHPPHFISLLLPPSSLHLTPSPTLLTSSHSIPLNHLPTLHPPHSLHLPLPLHLPILELSSVLLPQVLL